MAAQLQQQAQTLFLAGKYVSAIQEYQRAIEVALPEYEGVRHALEMQQKITVCYKKLDDKQAVISSQEKVLQYCEQLNRNIMAAKTCAELAVTCMPEYTTKSLEYLEKGEKLYTLEGQVVHATELLEKRAFILVDYHAQFDKAGEIFMSVAAAKLKRSIVLKSDCLGTALNAVICKIINAKICCDSFEKLDEEFFTTIPLWTDSDQKKFADELANLMSKNLPLGQCLEKYDTVIDAWRGDKIRAHLF